MDNSNGKSEELTFKELVIKGKEYLFEIRKRWLFIGLCIIICTGLFYINHLRSETIYPAEIKFLVDNDDSNGGMIGNLLGQFGIRKPTKNNPYKILEVARSNKMLRQIFRDEINNENIANYIIDSYDLRSRWSPKNPELEGYKYDPNSIDDRTSNLAFTKLKTFVWGSKDNTKSAKLKISIDEDSGIFKIESFTNNEDLSLSLVKSSYENIKYFFENEVIQNQLKSVLILNQKVDSLNDLRKSKSYEFSKFEDQNRNSLSYLHNAKKEILKQDILAVSITYSELMKNKELAEISLNDRKSSFMKIDGTLSPILPDVSSLLKSIFLGILIGFIIGGFIVVFRKITTELME